LRSTSCGACRRRSDDGQSPHPYPSPTGGGASDFPLPFGEGGRGRGYWAAGLVVLLAAVSGTAIWFFAFREPEPRNDLERFQGDWQITRDGNDTPNAIRVNGNTWEYVGGKAYRMTLNESAKEIDVELIDTSGLVGAPVKMHGIYTFSDNRSVRVLIRPALRPRPRTLDDPDEVPLVLKRVKMQQGS
jgi:hypothetical protein